MTVKRPHKHFPEIEIEFLTEAEQEQLRADMRRSLEEMRTYMRAKPPEDPPTSPSPPAASKDTEN